MKNVTHVFLDPSRKAKTINTGDGILDKNGLRQVNIENDGKSCYVFLEIEQSDNDGEVINTGNLILRGTLNEGKINWQYGSPLQFENALKDGIQPWGRLMIASLLSETESPETVEHHAANIYEDHVALDADGDESHSFGEFYSRPVAVFIDEDGSVQSMYTIFILPINAVNEERIIKEFSLHGRQVIA